MSGDLTQTRAGAASPKTSVPLKVVVLMPVFCDWECASLMCVALDKSVQNQHDVEMLVVLVDDGSPDPVDPWPPLTLRALRTVDVLLLTRNMGHQRAIAAGLCHVHDHVPCDAIIVMDADGEDRPEEAINLIHRFRQLGREQVLFAERGRRFEGPVFQTGYSFFRALHILLTGIPVKVGNFSIIARPALRRLVCMSELWNHYAGAVFRSRVPFQCIPLDRGRRLRGESKMNLVSLVSHGLSGIASFQETVATRILLMTVAGMALVAILILAVVAARFGTTLAIPGWATFTVGILLVLLVLLAATSFSLVFTLMVNRVNMTTVPIRDYRVFVDGVRNLWSAD
jgi:polyisoprenyl-phosphate glycosyltransferase